jgi:hypothetical protein
VRITIRHLGVLLAAGVGGGILMAPVAAAVPECINTGPNTTQCQTGGSTQIVTSPPVNNNFWGGWPWGGGLIVGIGGIGW